MYAKINIQICKRQSKNLIIIMQQNKSINQKVFQILKKYQFKMNGTLITQQQVDQRILLYKNSLTLWNQFLTPSTSPMNRSKLIKDLTPILNLKNQTVPPIPFIIVEYSQIKPVDINLREILCFKQLQLFPAQKNCLKINDQIKKHMKENFETSTNFQNFLTKEIKQIIQILQNRLSILDYYNHFIWLCQIIQKKFATEFKKITFIDFLIFLLKIINQSDLVVYLLSTQEIPIPIKFKTCGKLVSMIKSCRSVLKYNKYSLITNIGTKAALSFKTALTHKLFDVNEQFTKGSIFEDNVNILSIVNSRVILDCNGFQDISLDIPFKTQTSVLTIHITINDLQKGFIKKIAPLLQSIQRLLLIVWDGVQNQLSVQKQIFQLLTQNSFIKKSIKKIQKQDNFQQIIKKYIKISNLLSQKIQFLNTQEKNSIKAFINNEIYEKRFLVQQLYDNKQKQIDNFLQKYCKSPVQNLIFGYQLSPFVKGCAQYIQEPQFFQFAFFNEKLSNTFNKSISIKHIIASINTQNQANIDRNVQIQNSYWQEQMNNYYRKCLKNLYPFCIIDKQTSIFGSAGLERFFKNIYQSQSEKPIFFISVIGVKSAQKRKMMDRLFGCNAYLENQSTQEGLNIYLCQTIDSYIMIFEGDIKLQNKEELNEKQVIYNHQLLVFLMKISNLVLITSFNHNSKQLIQQIKICNTILLDFFLNQAQKSRILQKIIVVLPRQAEEDTSINDFRQALALFKNFYAYDIFIMPSFDKRQEREDYCYFILSLKNYIIRNIDQSRYSKRLFLQIYKNIKAQWQILQNVSHNQLKCWDYNTLTKYNQSLREIFDTIGEKRKKIQIFYSQQLNKAKAQIDKQLSQNTLNNENYSSLLFINPEQFLKKIQIIQSQEITQEARCNHILQHLRSFYSLIYQKDNKQYCRSKIIQYSQKEANRIFQKMFFQERSISLYQQIQKMIEKGEQFLKDEINKKDLIKYAAQAPLYKNIFQNLLESYQFLKGLQINSIQSCLDLFAKIKTEFDLNIDLMVENHDASQLSRLEKVSLADLISKKVGQFDAYFKDLFLSALTSQIILLDSVPSLIKIMDLNTQQLQKNIAQSKLMKKKLYLIKINYKRYLLGKIFNNCLITLSQKKSSRFSIRIAKIKSLIVQMEINKKLLLQFQVYYRNIQKLINQQRNNVKIIAGSKISQKDTNYRNIVKILQLASTDSLISDKSPSLLKKAIINSYKFVKNSQRYFSQIIKEQCQKIKNEKGKSLNTIIENIIQQVKENISIQLKPYKTENVDLYNSIDKQISIKIQVMINQIKDLYQQQRRKIDQQQIYKNISNSICRTICPQCKAQCRIQIKHQKAHQKHQFKHLLEAFGGPSKKLQNFSYEKCHFEYELKTSTNQKLTQYEQRLKLIWANIENILAKEKYRLINYKPTQEITKLKHQEYNLTQDILKGQKIQDY